MNRPPSHPRAASLAGRCARLAALLLVPFVLVAALPAFAQPGSDRAWVTSAAQPGDDGPAEAPASADPGAPVEVAEAPLYIRDGAVLAVVERAPWLGIELGRIAVWRWLGFVVSFSVLFVLRALVRALLRRALRAIGRRTDPDWIERLIQATHTPVGALLFALVAWVATSWLALSEDGARLAYRGWRLAAVVCVGWALLRAADLIAEGIGGLASRRQSSLDEHLVPLIARVARVVLFGLIVVIALQELGYNVAGLVAGLGIGGLAVALAAQDTLGNWFGAATLYADRPFEIGDWIKAGEVEGIVEDIGLRTTCIRTFARTELRVPNKTLAAGNIENFSRMNARRVRFTLGLTYSTRRFQLQRVVDQIRDVIASDPGVERDSTIVRFADFGASSLDIVILYFTVSTNYDVHLEVRERINQAILRICEENDAAIAFPSQTVYLETARPPRDGEPPVIEAAGAGPGGAHATTDPDAP